jgi:hypothetical protein
MEPLLQEVKKERTDGQNYQQCKYKQWILCSCVLYFHSQRVFKMKVYRSNKYNYYFTFLGRYEIR